MGKKEIIDLIDKEIEQGSSREQVVSNLIFAGFSYQEIQGALNEMAQKGKLPNNFLLTERKTSGDVMIGQKIKKIEDVTNQDEQESSAGKIVLRYKKVFLIVITGLLILAGGLFFGFYFYNISTSVITGKVLNNLSKISSGAFYLSADVDINKNNADGDRIINNLFSEKTTIESKGFFDIKTGSTLKYSLELSIKNGYDADASTQPIWDVGAIGTDSSTWYFKLNNLATTTKENQAFISQILPVWVLVDAPMQQLSDAGPQAIIKSLSDYRHILSSDAIGAIRLISDPELFKSIVSLGNQNIGNLSYYHYRVTLNPEKVATIISELYSSSGIDQSGWLSDLAKDSWEIWIDKTTLLPYQISIKNDIQNSSLIFDPRSVTIVLSGLNTPYIVNPPAQYSSLAHILEIIKNSNQ